MTTTYEHTQRSRRMATLMWVAALGALAATIVPRGMPLGPRLTLLAVVVALAGSAIVFSRLTIRVAEGALHWHFGAGMVKRRLPLAAIAAAEPTRTGVLDGWGIHFTSRGWLFNVAGRDAVLVTRTDGKTFMLGTDEPRALAEAIRPQTRPATSGA